MTTASPNPNLPQAVATMTLCEHCMSPIVSVDGGTWLHAPMNQAECLPPIPVAESERSNPPGADE